MNYARLGSYGTTPTTPTASGSGSSSSTLQPPPPPSTADDRGAPSSSSTSSSSAHHPHPNPSNAPPLMSHQPLHSHPNQYGYHHQPPPPPSNPYSSFYAPPPPLNAAPPRAFPSAPLSIPIGEVSHMHHPIPSTSSAGNGLIRSSNPGQGLASDVSARAPSSSATSSGLIEDRDYPSPQQQPAGKSRSVMACVLCRKQKMKCEGPEKAPCKRCRTAGVNCTFESPPQAPPKVRSGGASEAYFETRFERVEERIAHLEETQNTAVATRSSSSSSHSQEYERRIAALEAQVYALHIAAQSTPALHQPEAGYGPTTGGSSAMANYSPQPFPGSSSGGLAPGYPSLGKGAAHVNGGNVGGDSPRSIKRWKGEVEDEVPSLAAGDVIQRGIVTEQEASMCYESYFLNFAHRPTVIKSGAATSTPRAIDLPMAATRARSSLLFSTIVSIGARSLSRMDTYHATLNEAVRLCRATFLPEPDSEPTSLDLKGIMLLSLYNGMPDLMSHGIALSYRFGLPTALEEYEALSEEDKQGKRGETLVHRGRTFLVSFLWTSFYSYCRGQHGFYHIPDDVVRRQLDILEASPFAQQPSDRGIRVNAEECLVLRNVFERLGPAMRLKRPDYKEACRIVESGIASLLEWNRQNLPMMELITQWGDDAELKTVVPFHHGRMSLLMYIFRDLDLSDLEAVRARPKMYELANMAIESATVIFKWGVESRIWLPHSMVAQYLHHVNIPTAVQLLYTATRLYPSEANFPSIRQMLHRLLKQCDVCISGNAGTAREVLRAQQTKALVLEFDLYAFNAAGSEDDDRPLDKEEMGLFGDEISASLGAMGLELNLWGSILAGALED